MIDAATLRLRYPALSSATDPVIEYWLADAALIVTADWGIDQEPATLALAAHGIAQNSAASVGGVALPAGLTRFHSGSADITISETAANASLSGGYGSTRYGQEFQVYLRRNVGGPRLVGWPAC